MFFLLNCIMKLVFVVIDSCGIVVKLLWHYSENPVGLLWLLAALVCFYDSGYHCGSEQGSQLRIEAPRSGAEDSSIYIYYLYI